MACIFEGSDVTTLQDYGIHAYRVTPENYRETLGPLLREKKLFDPTDWGSHQEYIVSHWFRSLSPVYSPDGVEVTWISRGPSQGSLDIARCLSDHFSEFWGQVTRIYGESVSLRFHYSPPSTPSGSLSLYQILEVTMGGNRSLHEYIGNLIDAELGEGWAREYFPIPEWLRTDRVFGKLVTYILETYDEKEEETLDVIREFAGTYRYWQLCQGEDVR